MLKESGGVFETNSFLLNEDQVIPQLNTSEENQVTTNLWYLDNGASNHMMGIRSKFKELDEGVTGQVRFGDGFDRKYKGKGHNGLNAKMVKKSH